MKALYKNDTWDIADLPKGKRLVGCKRVFTIKFKVDGFVERYKARLATKGYTQTYGIDYHETFAPIAKMNSIKILLSLVANHNWSLQHFDIYNRQEINFRVLHLCRGQLGDLESKKQPIVARSSVEAEYRAMALGSATLPWMEQSYSQSLVSQRQLVRFLT
uniref:Reverse transcriptase Ty1/copia-type domain-containing protein n=1 Tax=Vitis vinifera TaxID=29760 RepID=A5B6K7_VITVI|nr:hypothetical protein VITISV_014235 [Vitis vinifera]